MGLFLYNNRVIQNLIPTLLCVIGTYFVVMSAFGILDQVSYWQENGSGFSYDNGTYTFDNPEYDNIQDWQIAIMGFSLAALFFVMFGIFGLILYLTAAVAYLFMRDW